MTALSLPLFARSLFLQTGFGDERRQGLGFAWSIDPALRAAYGADTSGLALARRRALESFNVQPHACGLPLGVVAALETKAAAGDAAAAARAAKLKPALAAALSGAADGFFWGGLRPLAAAVAIVVGAGGLAAGFRHSIPVGAALGLLVFNVPALAARWKGLAAGLLDGEAAAARAAGLPAALWTRNVRLSAAALVAGAALLGMTLPFAPSRAWAAAAFAAGALLSKLAGGALRLIAAAVLLGVAASAAGWY